MKNRVILLLIVVLLLACMNACKKDYPKDIPDWVKNDIRESKQKIIKCSKCDNHNPSEIDEYLEPNYGIVYGYKDGGYGINSSIAYYDYYQNAICIASYTGYCPSLPGFSPEYKRAIYSSNK